MSIVWTSEEEAESFPCIICGRSLKRVLEEVEAQPDDGVMCSTQGNYGSTVFDPDDYGLLVFNICDICLVRAGKAGRVRRHRRYRPVIVKGLGEVGRQRVDRLYVPWLPKEEILPDQLWLKMEDLDMPPEGVELRLSVARLKEHFEAYEHRRDGAL